MSVEYRAVRSASMTATSPAPPVLIRALIALTLVASLVDAGSFLALGHVFTANMTGNVVFLAFAVAGAPGLSVPRSAAALGAWLLRYSVVAPLALGAAISGGAAVALIATRAAAPSSSK
jgi:uncharacterized membrane protein YoaK (UPF0700 family)